MLWVKYIDRYEIYISCPAPKRAAKISQTALIQSNEDGIMGTEKQTHFVSRTLGVRSITHRSL